MRRRVGSSAAHRLVSRAWWSRLKVGIPGTRREYVPVGSDAASMPRTVQAIPASNLGVTDVGWLYHGARSDYEHDNDNGI